MAVDLRNFLFHSEYPIDKVVKMMSGSINIPANAGGISGTAYAHGMPFTPLDITIFSTSADFSTSIDSGFPPYAALTEYGIIAETNGTNLYIRPWDNSGVARTVYWRSVMIEPSDSNADVPYTAVNADIFQFNTAYNYSKLVMANFITSSQTIAHNLGYVPQVLLWAVSPAGFTYRLTDNDFDFPSSYVNSTEIIFNLTNANSATKIHYRIYGDD